MSLGHHVGLIITLVTERKISPPQQRKRKRVLYRDKTQQFFHISHVKHLKLCRIKILSNDIKFYLRKNKLYFDLCYCQSKFKKVDIEFF